MTTKINGETMASVEGLSLLGTVVSGGATDVEGADSETADAPRLRSWFNRLVIAYLRYHYAQLDRAAARTAGRSQKDLAESTIRRACIKAAATGATAGVVTTSATLLTAEGGGAIALLAVPCGALAIGGEMLYRALIHVEMTCDLADIFGVRFNPEDPSDFWRLYSLAFGHQKHEDAEDPGKALVDRVTEEEGKEVGEKIGSKLLGESVLRNALPIIGIVASSYSNWRLTQRLGDTVRRYVRYQRALDDALAGDLHTCHAHLDLLTEGLWFIFTADGRLSPEEAAVLAGFVKKCEPVVRRKLSERFVDDETDWLSRLKEVAEPARDAFQHALEVAAAVDKSVSLPEQKVLTRAAQALGRKFDMQRVSEMIRQFESTGVLGPRRAAHG